MWVANCTNQELQQWYKKHGIHPKLILAKCAGRQHTHTGDTQVEVVHVVTTKIRFSRHIKLLQQQQQDNYTIIQDNTYN